MGVTVSHAHVLLSLLFTLTVFYGLAVIMIYWDCYCDLFLIIVGYGTVIVIVFAPTQHRHHDHYDDLSLFACFIILNSSSTK